VQLEISLFVTHRQYSGCTVLVFLIKGSTNPAKDAGNLIHLRVQYISVAGCWHADCENWIPTEDHGA